MIRLRDPILEWAVCTGANSYVRINLSLFDLFPRDACPSIPPELILLPGKLIYQMSSWTRAIVISLAIVHSAIGRFPRFHSESSTLQARSASCSATASCLPFATSSWRRQIPEVWERCRSLVRSRAMP